jgi:phosphate:Na+ symporter
MGIFATEWIFGILGGLGLFMFGLVSLGSGLQKVMGDRLRQIIKSFADKPLIGVLIGAALTVLFQSSSATAVVVVGLFGARLLTMSQVLVVLLGAHIGTTIIAQIVTFRVEHYALLAIAVGFGMQYFATRRHLRYLGQAVLGLGLAFVGLNMLSSVFYSLAQNHAFQSSLLGLGKYPVLGFLAGTLVTALTQSGNATIGLVQSLAKQQVLNGGSFYVLLPLSSAVPIVLGTNIGSCVAVALTCLGRTRNAKKAVLAYFFMNLIGSLLLLLFIPGYSRIVSAITYQLIAWASALPQTIFGNDLTPMTLRDVDMISREIAMAHTVFAVINALIWLPLIKPLVRFVEKFLPGKDQEPQDGPKYLDEGMLNTPSVALDLAILEITHMSEISLQMLKHARQAFTKGSVALIREVEKKEELVDELQDRITLYLSTLLSRSVLTTAQSKRLAGLLHVVNDVERVGDHAHNIAQYAEAKLEEKLPFSELAINELEMLFGKTDDIMVRAVEALRTHDPVLAKKAFNRENAIDKLEAELRQNHINRLNQGKCWPGSGVVYVELLNNLERIADHAVNIAQVVLEEEGNGEG